jgi:hypothetical protein
MSCYRKVRLWPVISLILLELTWLGLGLPRRNLSLFLSALNGLVGTAMMSLLLGVLIGFELEDAAVVDSANIVLAHDTIFRPEQEIGGKPLEERCTPAEKVHGHSLTFVHSDQIIGVEATFVATIVL